MADDIAPNSANPIAFVSYSRESEAHIERVVALADRLNADGVDCHVDEYEEAPARGWPHWMEQQVMQSKFVLMICTNSYRRYFDGQAEPGRGLGVSWERSIISAALYKSAGQNDTFIPVLFSTQDQANIPALLQGTTYYDLSRQDGYERLLRRLTAQPRRVKPRVGPIKNLPSRSGGRDKGEVSFSHLDYQVVLDMIAEQVQFLAPGILPRVSKGFMIEGAVLRGLSHDAATRIMHALGGDRLFTPLGISGNDELIVDLERLELLREVPRSLPNDVQDHSPAGIVDSPQVARPRIRVRFRNDDGAGEPNYYVELALGFGDPVQAGPVRLLFLCYTPRNAFDPTAGLWPINVIPNHDLPVYGSLLGQDNYATLLGQLPEKEYPGFHLASGAELRVNGVILPGSEALLATLEVFGPDMVLDWRLDSSTGTIQGTERLSRPADKDLPVRFTMRSRVRLAVRNSQVESTPGGDRIVCDVIAPDFNFRVNSSCWAELIEQWGTDLTARTLIKEALGPAMTKVQELKADALARASSREGSGNNDPEYVRQCNEARRDLLNIKRLEYQLALETPIRLDDYYARVLEHYREKGDNVRLPGIRDEWSKAIARSTSRVSMPPLDGVVD